VSGPLGALGAWLRSVAPRRAALRADIVAGLPNAVSAVPDGMASGVLAGVNPVAGLYASFAGPIAGGLGTSTRLMVITTTSAGALAAGSGVSGVAPADRPGALTLLTLLAGALMIVAGVLRLGRYTRFVAHSVMLGFLSGVAVNIILGQLADLTGTSAEGSTNLAKAYDVLRHPGEFDVATLSVGLAALALLVVLARTKLAIVSALVALALPSIVVIVAGLDSVARVSDTGDIPAGLPLPALPDFGQFSVSLVSAAAAVAAIILVQGAGVAESAPNDDGPSKPNQDFIAQGAGNVASGLFRGMPVGGSVGSTALNRTAGGRTRWSAIAAGVWMIVILVAFSGIVGEVAMATLAAILVFAAWGSLRPREVASIWRTGPNAQIALVATFAATLLLPVAAAVGLGVVISLLLQLNQEAIDLTVVELVTDDEGRFVEAPAPARLRSDAVTVLDVYGSLFYAGARTLQARLPDPTGSHHAAVVLRLRGRTSLGATFFAVVDGYADRLGKAGGRLYLTGLDPALERRLAAPSPDPLTGSARLYPAEPVVGASTLAALQDARTWQVGADRPDP
jgi:SulP family sulfate permease